MNDRPEPDQPPWWQGGVIYQIYPRSLKDSNGDGIGDLQGIISKLDYFTWLGVDALWISPIYPSPMVDLGYDVSNYVDIDPLFGDLATFDLLVAQAHQRGLKIIMDYVPNHTSDQHPWFLQSRSSRYNPKRDWYVWVDPKPGGLPPNNWIARWDDIAWEWDAATNQYYLHSFDKAMPDLNWRNPAVKEAMFNVARFWLDRGVDGLRIDSAQYIMKDPQLRDNPPNPDPRVPPYKSMGDYDSQLHINDRNYPDIHEVYRELRHILNSYNSGNPRVALGELHIYDWSAWTLYYGTHLDEIQMPINFGLLTVTWNADAVHHLINAVEAALQPGDWPNYVLGNHDVPRIVTRIGQQEARVALMLLLTLRGTPTLYYGDEIGMHDVEIPLGRVRDTWEKNIPESGFGRDPERTPMQWDNSPNAGFCPPTARPWLPMASDYQQVNVAAQRQDQHSVLSLVRTLLQLRRATPALAMGSYTPVECAASDCFVYQRQFGDEHCLIALNFSSDERQLHLPTIQTTRVLVSTYLDREESVDLTPLRLRGNEGCIIEVK